MTGIFALTLRKDGKSPFPPQSDEVTFGEKKDEAKPEADDEKKDDEGGGGEGQGEGRAGEEGDAVPDRLRRARLRA